MVGGVEARRALEFDPPFRREWDVGSLDAIHLGDLVGSDLVDLEGVLGALVHVEEPIARLGLPQGVGLHQPLVAVVANADAEAVARGETHGLELALSGSEREIGGELDPRY